jgi:multiple sugar transport system substrate-binding protein
MTIQEKGRQFRNILARLSTRAIALFCLTLTACGKTAEISSSSVKPSPSTAADLEIWWDKGFTIEEDEALQKLVRDWEKRSGKTIALSFYSTDDLFQKLERELQSGNLPDLIAMFKSEKSLTPRLAWEGKLADISDVLQTRESLYSPMILKAAKFYNNVDKKRSYYALPIHQATIHVYYWKDLLGKIGYRSEDIPREWDRFWLFWPKAREELTRKENLDIYGLGLPLSVEAGDTYQTFEQILEAYNIKILNEKGELQLEDPQVRQGIIKILDWYRQNYRQGNFSPKALHWLNPDNNRDLLNKKVLMTTNDTLSIATAVRGDPDTYRHKLGVLELPKKPNGEPMRYLVTVQQVILLAKSPHQKEAKNFLAYLIQPETIDTYLKSAGGRHSPVLKSVWKDPFWHDRNDPPIWTATHTFTTQPQRLFYTFDNPAYSIVLKENVWGQALQKVIVKNVSSEQAANEAIARIETIFNEWK